MGQSRLVIAVASLGDYRAGLVDQLRTRLGKDLSIFAGAPAYDNSIRLIDYNSAGVVPLKNIYLKGRVLLQLVPIVQLWRADGLVMDLNPRVLHVWIVVILRRLARRKTMLWGHAWSRGGPHSLAEKIRHALRTLATGCVTYTEEQASSLRSIHPRKSIVAAPNALYSRNDMKFDESSHRFRVLFVGRLVAEKKPMALLEAFLLAARDAPSLVLTFVGDGPERNSLEKYAGNSEYSARVVFMGYISDLERLRGIYSETIVSVSPGYVGLAVTQSLAFGVPMLVSKAEPHSPELEAVKPGFNAEFFETDNVAALATGIISFSEHEPYWTARGTDIVEDCRFRYSTERMAEGIIAALHI